uniref:Reverse transcriptase domain-containing protein n=1 Tax=Strongyloides venezuelensis TaxID=75913 RepID=A0A0K0FRU2_STRVS
MKNLLENSIPSAPTVDDSKMIVFLGAYEAVKKKWIEEQRVLTSNSSATEDDKILLGHQQSDKLYEMLKFFNVRDDKNYLVPITWGTKNPHPRLQGLTNIIVSQSNKNRLLKPFLKGGDVEFGIWKEDTFGFIKGLAVDTEGYNLCNQLCMFFVNNFIPKVSEISALLKKALGKRVDESFRLMNHLFISDLFDEIWHEMRESQIPWQHLTKDSTTTSRILHELSNVYATRLPKRSKIRYSRKCTLGRFPEKICKGKSFLNTLEDTGVEENPHRCRTKDSNNNHVKNKTFLNNKTENFNKNHIGQKKRFNNNKIKCGQSKPNSYNNDNRKSNVPNNGYINNNNNQIVPYNDSKKIYSNVNQGNIRRTVSSNVANNNVKFNIPNKGRATKPGKRGPQINAIDIESLTDKICSKMQDLILTAKVSTLIKFCLVMFFIASAGAQSNIFDIYSWEDCDNPRIPTFYRLTDTYLENTMTMTVTLTSINEQCEIDTKREPIIDFEIDNLIIILVVMTPKVPKKYTYKVAMLTKCDPSAVVMVDNRYYTHTVNDSDEAKQEMDINKDFIKDVREKFLLRCPDWNFPHSEKILSEVFDTETASAGDTQEAAVTPPTESIFDDFTLPDWDIYKQGQRIKSKTAEYLKRASNVFNNMKKLTMSMEKNTKRLQIEKNSLEDSCMAADKTASRNAVALSKNKENEIKRLKNDIALLKQEKSKMILQESHDIEVNQLKNELKLQKNGRLVAERDKKHTDETNLNLGKRITLLEAYLQTRKNDLEITMKKVKTKQKELTLLSSAPHEDEITSSSDDLTNCLKLLSEANAEKSTIERTLTSQHSKEKLLVENQVLDLIDKNKRLSSTINRVKFNGAFIMKKIHNINHKSDNIACIQPDEVVHMKKNLKAVEQSPHYNSYADITKKLNNMVKEMNSNSTSQDYESILTFFGGVVTTILRRIKFRNTNNRYTCSRISSTPQRGILVNRHSRVGEQVNSILAPYPSIIPQTKWNPHIVIMINDNDCEALIDTEATINVMSRKLCNEPAIPIKSS